MDYCDVFYVVGIAFMAIVLLNMLISGIKSRKNRKNEEHDECVRNEVYRKVEENNLREEIYSIKHQLEEVKKNVRNRC